MIKLLAAAALCVATPAGAEVVKSGEHGFELRYSHIVSGPPAEAMEAFGHVENWWDGEHTYSGSASNLVMSLTPGGCFCEKLANGGGIEHMRVVYVDPGKRLLLTGSLGPLLYEATSGVLDVQFVPVGAGSKVTVSYKVAGFANGGAARLAPLVDDVLARQIAIFAVFATRPRTLR